MTAPSKAQLDRYMDLMVDGQDADDAIEAIWGPDTHDDDGNQLTPAEVPVEEPVKAKPPVVMVTEFPDGVVIGWDFCTANNRGCGKHVSKCACKGGPKEPVVFDQWRTGTKVMPNYGAPAAAASSSPAPATTVRGPGKTTSNSAGQVPCVLGKHLVPQDQADQNDDHTWSCFACQEAGMQRGVQVDG